MHYTWILEWIAAVGTGMILRTDRSGSMMKVVHLEFR
jgi:hypothetical protein